MQSAAHRQATVNFLCNYCFDSQETCPYIKLSLLKGTSSVRMQRSISNCTVLTSRMSLHQVSLQRESTACVTGARVCGWDFEACRGTVWPQSHRDQPGLVSVRGLTHTRSWQSSAKPDQVIWRSSTLLLAEVFTCWKRIPQHLYTFLLTQHVCL